jgi:hypothetical protein
MDGMYVFWQPTVDAAGEGRAVGVGAGDVAGDVGLTCDGGRTAAGRAAPPHEHTASAGSKTAAAAAIAIFDTTPTTNAGPPRSGDGTNGPHLSL